MASPYVLLLYGGGQQLPRGDSGITHAGCRVSGACWIACVQLLSSAPYAARCPHVPRSTPHHSLTCLYAPMPCVTPRLWWTPPAVSVCHPHGPHTPASAARPWQSSTCVSRDPRRLRSDRLGASRRGTARCSARPWPRGAARPVLVVTLMPEVAHASALRGRWDPDRRAASVLVRARGLPVVWRCPHGVQRCAVPAPGGGAGAVWQRRVLLAGAEVGDAPGVEAAAVSRAPTEARVMPTRTTRSDLHAQAAATRAARPTSGAGPPPGGRPRRSTLVLGVLVLAAVVSTRWVRLN